MRKTNVILVCMLSALLIGNVYAELDNTELDNKNVDHLQFIGPEKVTRQEDTNLPVIIVFKQSQTDGDIQAQSKHINTIYDNGGRVKHTFHIINGVAAELPQRAISALSEHKDVLSIEPDIKVFAQEQQMSWGVSKVNARAFHQNTKGSGVKIAILDSGIDYNHPDLDGNYKGGYDFVNDDDDPMDDYGHGTSVAGIIAAEDNSIGVLGVAPEASIYGVKVIGNDGSGYSSNVIKGIEWAVDNDMDIISMSLGGNRKNNAYETAVINAYNSGVLLVASAGNNGSSATDSVMYPAKYDSVIAVTAINQDDEICSFSSVGPSVEFTAPGLLVDTTDVGGSYGYFSGTSAAAPFVSGVAALTMASNPSLTNEEIRTLMRQNTIDLDPPGRDNTFGYGIPTPVLDEKPLNVDVTIQSNPVYSKRDVQISIHAESDGISVSGATVVVFTSNGDFNSIEGMTNSNGDFITSYTAPMVESPTTMIISARVVKKGYQTGIMSGEVTVNPAQKNNFFRESLHPYDLT